MKFSIRTIAAVAAIMPAVAALALESKQLSLRAGLSETVDLGFVPAGYKQQSGSDAVSVSLAAGTSSATVTGLKEGGRSQIEFPDPTGEGVLLTVDVVSGLDETLRKLRRMLSDFDGLQFSKGNSKVLIDGTIGNPSDWAKFERVLKLSDFQGKTESIVEFSVDPGTIGALRREFEAAGFKLAAPGATPGEGQLAIKYEHNVMTVSGTLWSQADQAKALAILKGKSWLELVDRPTRDAASSPIVQTVFTASVDDALLELGVAFLKISKSAIKTAESGAGKTLKAFWGGLREFVIMGGHRKSMGGSWNDFTIDVGLNHTLQLLAQNNVTREKEYGTMRFHANSDSGKKLNLGGTLTVTPDATGEGEAPSPQTYEYGFKIVNMKSRRVSSDMAEADFVLEINGPPDNYQRGGIKGTVVHQETKTLEQTVRVPLGKTVAVAGHERLRQFTENTGMPVLRHVPILGWFVSDRADELEDSTMLFLVSVRAVDVANEEPMVPNTPMKDITLDANTDNAERIKKEQEELKERRRGCTPLSWFRW